MERGFSFPGLSGGIDGWIESRYNFPRYSDLPLVPERTSGLVSGPVDLLTEEKDW
jgi:hypothetical protein